ncbi:glycosyltransferase family 87 protein [Bradyrhizobium sp.]|uniref:glycosyltransferase family 87 protein n=1 Tax=Bradyrhizobium sp. TaxID=376 RepID=UPI0027236173|nr:glycosyltransferase family 87 protein [Bradyrhizobium sp.]MDO9295543.1 glycosyltransferase family 87 protein [Bradyrhizobium sp.]
MATPVSVPTTPGEHRAIPPALLNVCFALAVINLSFFPTAYLAHWWITDSAGLGIPTDFVNVWAAGRLALDGHPAQAWDWNIQKQVEVALLGQDFTGYFAWHYPPPFLFIASLLAHFPYAVAFIGWALLSLVPYLAMMRAIVGRPFGLLLAVAVPMAFNNVLVGQNGFLTAALIGGTLYLMPVRPMLSGICLGLLSYKPQYGLLFPLVLIAASQWTVFFTAAVVTVVMAVASWLAFGTESWQAFFHWMPMFSQAFLTEGKAPWWKMQSLFALVRTFGGTEQLAWIFHWIFAGAVAVVLALMWRSRVRYAVKAAALATGTLLTTPYLFMYDMMVLAIPVAFLVRIGLSSGFLAWELPALACALAMIAGFILTGVPLGFGATLIVAGLVLRRASLWRRPEPAPSMVSAAT